MGREFIKSNKGLKQYMLNIKILVSGCTNCVNLEKLCKEVVAENNIEAVIEKITDILIYSLIGLTPKAHLTDAAWFFIFEVPKVLLLLILIVFIVGIIRTYFSPERMRKILGGKKLLEK